MAPGAPTSSAPTSLPEGLLLDLMAVSLTGVNVLRPLYGPVSELTDFVFVYINPAAQQMTGQPEQPAGTLCALYPTSVTNGVFDLYRRVFTTGQADLYQVNYQADGLDNYFHVAARRSGDLLLVSFTDTRDQNRSPVEEALRQSQAREQARTRELADQQRLLSQILAQVPAAITSLHGPEHRFTFTNDRYQRLTEGRVRLGQTVAETLPEVAEQGFIELLDEVYRSSQTFEGKEIAVLLAPPGGTPAQHYFDFTYQPLPDAHGQTQGLLVFAVDVTEQVRISQQVQALNEELRESNRQLTRTNSDLDTFVYTASHDLKAPIANIEGILHALRDTLPPAVPQDEVVVHLLGLLDGTVSRFFLTIEQLTDLTRLQQTYQEAAQSLALAPIVTGVLAILAPSITAAAT
jgi:signal transduction histidine kinase